MPRNDSGLRRAAAGALSAVLLAAASGCASKPEDPLETHDPLEPINRPIMSFNLTLDKWILRPLAKGYEWAAPRPMEIVVQNFFDNLRHPQYIINAALQGKPGVAGTQTGRLLLNSTIGVGGLFDFATEVGMKRQVEDFGQTLAAWGVPQGPYLVLPLIGPSSPRGLVGWAGDRVTDPLTQPRPKYENSSIRDKLLILRFIDDRRQLLPADKALEEAADKYIFIREAYLQRREFLIYDGDPPEEEFIFEDEE